MEAITAARPHSCTAPFKVSNRSAQLSHLSLGSKRKWTGGVHAVRRCWYHSVMSASEVGPLDSSTGFGEELTGWINSHGGGVGKVVVVKEASGTWGLQASEECKEGDVLIKLPSESKGIDLVREFEVLDLFDQ